MSSLALILVCALTIAVVAAVLWRGAHGSGQQPSGNQIVSDGALTTSAPAPSLQEASTSPARETAQTIVLGSDNKTVQPYQTVRLTGRVGDGKKGVPLRIQQLIEQRWVSFPLPVMTGQRGRFTAFVELAQSGQTLLRAVRPGTDISSNIVSVTIALETS